MPRTVFVAMSGGVDSSVAALRLLEEGHRVVGVTLRLYDACGRPGSKSCCALEDAADAREVARTLGVEHRVLEHSGAFERLVVGPFLRDYAAGRTPNPCILCNDGVKFGTLLQYALGAGADFLATGHHARLVARGGRVELRRGADPEKDQSYVLFTLDAERRGRVLFPVGDLTKSEVRARAAAAGLPTAGKGESQDVCFVPPEGYAALLESRGLAGGEGFIRHADGRILGRHAGVHRFTVGQRRGIGVPAAGPLYVVRIDADRREVVVGPAGAVPSRSFEAEGWRWQHPEDPPRGTLLVQTRYHQEPAPAHLLEGEGAMRIEWEGEPRTAAPGQAAVAYLGDAVVGGGWISRTSSGVP